MTPLETLSLVLGAGFASGLNVYATVATLGLLQRFGVINLPQQLQVLSHPFVLAIAGTLYLMEFLADKVPYLDTVWDFLHTFIRPPAAAVLAFGVSAGIGTEWRWAAALLAGGIALTSHGTKASTRAAANTVPEPFSNWALSIGEDLLAVWLTWFTTAHPILALVLVALLLLLCFPTRRSSASSATPSKPFNLECSALSSQLVISNGASQRFLFPIRFLGIAWREKNLSSLSEFAADLPRILIHPLQKRLIPKLAVQRLQHPMPLIRKHHQP